LWRFDPIFLGPFEQKAAKGAKLRFSRPGGTGREIGVGIGLAPYPSLRTGQADFPHPALQLMVILFLRADIPRRDWV